MDPVDKEFGIFRDAMFYFLPVILLFDVFAFKRILGGIFQRLPGLAEKMGMTDQFPVEANDQFAMLFTPAGFQRFERHVGRWAASRLELLLFLAFIPLLVTSTYDNWWTEEGFSYAGRTQEPYTAIAGATMMLMLLLVVALASSFLWFITTFILAISRLDHIARGSKGESSLNLRMTKEENQVDHKRSELSYHVFHANAKNIGEFMFQLCLSLIIIGFLISVTAGFSQLVTVEEPNPLVLAIVLFMDIFILVLFFIPQLGIHQLLSRAKSLSLISLEQLYLDLQNAYISEASNLAKGSPEVSQHLDRVGALMNTLGTIITKEQQASTWAFEPPALLGLIGGSALTAIAFLVEFAFSQL
ncbi:MAG: hypothetical protein ACE5OZ_13480 [Candidatus Heimdallarchaeota archaeon]